MRQYKSWKSPTCEEDHQERVIHSMKAAIVIKEQRNACVRMCKVIFKVLWR